MRVNFFYNKNVELVLLLAVVVADDSLTALLNIPLYIMLLQVLLLAIVVDGLFAHYD